MKVLAFISFAIGACFALFGATAGYERGGILGAIAGFVIGMVLNFWTWVGVLFYVFDMLQKQQKKKKLNKSAQGDDPASLSE